MGRFFRQRAATTKAGRSQSAAESIPWHEKIASTARSHGAMPYTVEGFVEITEAVRRGHAVLVRRETAEVADGVTVFDSRSSVSPITGAFSPVPAPKVADPVVAILRFNVGSARFVLQDAGSATGGIELTPRRLQRYLDAPDRSTGVALGA